MDTSDAAYEKRHRKYETFEKRQRLREKEKLKHEHYKLKERIEQLRAMDSSAFLAIPASEFADTPGFGADAASAAAAPDGDVAGLHGAVPCSVVSRCSGGLSVATGWRAAGGAQTARCEPLQVHAEA